MREQYQLESRTVIYSANLKVKHNLNQIVDANVQSYLYNTNFSIRLLVSASSRAYVSQASKSDCWSFRPVHTDLNQYLVFAPRRAYITQRLQSNGDGCLRQFVFMKQKYLSLLFDAFIQ